MPIPFADFWATAWRGACGIDAFQNKLREVLGLSSGRLTSSGKAACYFALKTISKLSEKRTVIVPAYICPTVVVAIYRAGFRSLIVDVQKNEFSFDPNALKVAVERNSDIAAVLVCHLAGLPVDVSEAQAIVKGKKIFIIEDAAQSLGAQWQGQSVGTVGDFGFFSFTAGKGITTFEGGLLMVRDAAIGKVADEVIENETSFNRAHEVLRFVELSFYSLFYRRQLFWFVFRLHERFWQAAGQPLRAVREQAETDFPLYRLSNRRAYLGFLQIDTYLKNIQFRQKLLAIYSADLQGLSGVQLMKPAAQGRSNLPFLCLRFENVKNRAKFLKLASATGLGVSQLFSRAIPEYSSLKGMIEFADTHNALEIPNSLVTLSTHQDVDNSVVGRVMGLLKSALA